MRNRKFRQYWTLTGILLLSCSLIGAQPNTTVEIPKQEKYQNRVLASEKTGNKKFTIPKRLYNNTVSHYNYYFNASNKLKDIIGNAKLQHKENYRELLPFYNYSLNQTSKGQIVIITYRYYPFLVLKVILEQLILQLRSVLELIHINIIITISHETTNIRIYL